MKFPQFTCRKCNARNPIVYFVPVCVDNKEGTCICMPCAEARNWLDKDDNLKHGVTL